MNHQRSQAAASSNKMERRVIEKNRRTQMKILFSQLNSLLPDAKSKEALPVPDQIDEAISYIKTLEANLNEFKEKKERLVMGKKRSYEGTNFGSTWTPKSNPQPEIKIKEIGSALEVVLTRGLDYQFLFYEILQIFQQERADVLNVSFSVVGDLVFHTVHAEVGDSIFHFGAAKISEKLKRLVCGSPDDLKPQLEWPDFDIHSEMWEGFFSTKNINASVGRN